MSEFTTNKLTDWVKEPSIRDLKQNIDNAYIEQQSHLSNLARWDSNFCVSNAKKTNKNRSTIQPKVIRKHAEWRYSSLSEPFLNSPDMFEVSPTTAGDVKRATQNALILNYQFNQNIDKVAFIDEYIREAVDTGTVICEVGWYTKEEEITSVEPIYKFNPIQDPMLIQQYVQLLQLRMTDKDKYADIFSIGLDQALNLFEKTGVTYVPEQVGEKEVTETKETANYPTVEVCIQENIIIDPSCEGNIKKAKFIGKKFKSTLAELKEDGRYHNLDRIGMDSSTPITYPDYTEAKDTGNFTFQDKYHKQFIVHSYWGDWDIDDTGTLKSICAFWVGSTLVRLEENPFPDRKPPFIKAVYMPVRKSLYGEPDGELLEDNQNIIGAVTRGMIDLLGRSANGQTGFKKGMLDITNKRKYLRGEDYEFNTNDDPRQGIHMHTYPEIPRSAYDMLMMENNEAESLTGEKAFSSGITGQALGNSVANGRSVLDAASKREIGILRRLAAGIIEIGRKFISMNSEFLSAEEVVRVTNTQFISVRRDDLSGKFDLTLNIATAEEENKKAEELSFMLQTLGNNFDSSLTILILTQIARLRKMPDVAKKLEEWQPPKDPMKEEEAQLQIQLLKAQIAKEQALAMKHSSEAEMNGVRGMKDKTEAYLNAAKTDVEKAKAKHLGSQSDKTDLDYLEQESGVKQTRDLEKISLQNQLRKGANNK